MSERAESKYPRSTDTQNGSRRATNGFNSGHVAPEITDRNKLTIHRHRFLTGTSERSRRKLPKAVLVFTPLPTIDIQEFNRLKMLCVMGKLDTVQQRRLKELEELNQQRKAQQVVDDQIKPNRSFHKPSQRHRGSKKGRNRFYGFTAFPGELNRQLQRTSEDTTKLTSVEN